MAQFYIPISCPPALVYGLRGQGLRLILRRLLFPRVLLRYGLIKPDRRHTWCVNDGPLGFTLVFHTPLVSLISCRPPQLRVPLALFLSFYLVSLYFVFSWIFICPFSVGSFLVFSFSYLIPGPTVFPSRRIPFDWYHEALGFRHLDFVYTVGLRHGSKSFFFFA